MNLPNKLTVLRMLCTPLTIILFYIGWYLPCAILFVLACSTDMMDGYIARKNNIVTVFGKLFDPLADKLINIAILIVISAQLMRTGPVWYGIIASVSTCAIVARELLILGFRAFAASEGVVIAADTLGKIKTVIQDITITFILVDMSGIFQGAFIAALVHWTGVVLLVISLILTIASGVNYFNVNKTVTEKVFNDV